MENDQKQNMEERTSPFKDLFKKAEEYGKTSIELLRLKTLDISSDLLSLLISRLIVVFVLLMCVLMLSIGFAVFIGDVLGNFSYGFFIVGAFYALVCLIVYFFLGDHIKRYVTNLMIKQTLK